MKCSTSERRCAVTATQFDNRRFNPCCMCIVLVLAVIIVFLSLAPPSNHARQNHNANAWSVTQRFKNVDPHDDDVWQKVCPDNRRYTFRDLGDGAFDVSIDDPFTGENITRFSCTSMNWIARKLAWCE